MIIEHRVSGYDFVRAILLAGYRLVGTTAGHAVMAKANRELFVPQRDNLEDDVILSLLEQADVQLPHFVALLHRLGSRDTFPEQSEVVPITRAATRTNGG